MVKAGPVGGISPNREYYLLNTLIKEEKYE